MSVKSVSATLSSERYCQLFCHLRAGVPFAIRSYLTLGNEIPLFPQVTLFDYAILAQRRYWASSRNNNIANSLTVVQMGPGGLVSVGELTEISVVIAPPRCFSAYSNLTILMLLWRPCVDPATHSSWLDASSESVSAADWEEARLSGRYTGFRVRSAELHSSSWSSSDWIWFLLRCAPSPTWMRQTTTTFPPLRMQFLREYPSTSSAHRLFGMPNSTTSQRLAWLFNIISGLTAG